MPFIRHEEPIKTCRGREHEPPTMIVLKPGKHTWECPDCHETQTIEVPEINL